MYYLQLDGIPQSHKSRGGNYHLTSYGLKCRLDRLLRSRHDFEGLLVLLVREC